MGNKRLPRRNETMLDTVHHVFDCSRVQVEVLIEVRGRLLQICANVRRRGIYIYIWVRRLFIVLKLRTKQIGRTLILDTF